MQDCPTCGSEGTLPEAREHQHDFVGDSDYCTHIGCYLTYGEYRYQRRQEAK